MSTARARPPELSVEGISGGKSLWHSLGHDKVSFRMRRLESQLVWAIAAYTLWAGAFLDPGNPAVWLVALYAAVIGGWCRLYPAHHQWLMLVRGILLLCGAFALQVGAGSGGPTGPHFIWSAMATTVYALLLAPRWAVLLAALALVQFAAACIVAAPPASWQLAAAQAGVLGFFAAAATIFGRPMRELDLKNELARMDRNTRLYNQAGFLAHGAELFDDCRGKKRPFAMVLLHSGDLDDVTDLVGKDPANRLFAQLVDHIAAATPREGIAAHTDPVEFGLALPGLTAERAAARIRQHLGEPPKVELALKGSRVVIMLDSVIAEATPEIPSLADMYERMRSNLRKRFSPEVPIAPEQGSTLQGLLDKEPPVPHHARPTVPMTYAKPKKRE